MSVAQLAERRFPKPEVIRSIRIRPARISRSICELDTGCHGFKHDGTYPASSTQVIEGVEYGGSSDHVDGHKSDGFYNLNMPAGAMLAGISVSGHKGGVMPFRTQNRV